ncbi:MAG TPA: hypothetical protein VN428_18200 [Bryobacteraceae bacterium]|nr:hypothetical protein [Bryobacteraceae bacterium]
MAGQGGIPRMINADYAILETQEARKDISCTVEPVKPALGFDMRFHSGYEVSIPLKELAGNENLLTMIFRVAPEGRRDEPVYFSQRVKVPEIAADAGGNAYLQGYFDLGEGKYHIDWLMRDRNERFCSSYWEVEAELPPRDRQVALQLGPGAISPADEAAFKDEPPVERISTEPPLNVKVLVNFAPQRDHSATLQPVDTSALVAILRGIAREPRIGRFSIIAFNLQEQRVIYRQENGDRIDFPALGDALQSLNLGTVDLKRLEQKHGETEFLASLIQKELGGDQRPDALIFAGPKALIDEKVPTDSLREVGDVEFPVFYMNYNLQPQSMPWRDAIGRAVKFFRGYEFTISRPRDLWTAMTEMVGKIVQFKSVRRLAGAASQ